MSGPADRWKAAGLGWRQLAVVMEGTAQIGCLTLVIILAALGLGLWLDRQFGTRPWLTLTFVLGSIPVSTAALVWAALTTARRAQLPTREKPSGTTDSTDSPDSSGGPESV